MTNFIHLFCRRVRRARVQQRAAGPRRAGGGLRQRGGQRVLAGQEQLGRGLGRGGLRQDGAQQAQPVRHRHPGLLPRCIRSALILNFVFRWAEYFKDHP